MKKNTQELIKEAAKIAKEHQHKKDVIEKILIDLDKLEKITPNHLIGISTVNDILKEIEILEIEHSKILEQIKNK